MVLTGNITVKDMCIRRMKEKKKRRLIMEKIIEGVEDVGLVMPLDDDTWIQHYYGTYQKILLVGERDFSFSAALAAAFGSASNIIATSLETPDFFIENYENALSNIVALRKMGCKVMHGVDARHIANHSSLQGLTFDRIVFNFPYCSDLSNKSRTSRLRRYRGFVRKFIENAAEMIGENGEIHITHKTDNGVHREWDITNLAFKQRLQLIQVVGFEVNYKFNSCITKTYMFRFSV